MTLPEDAPDIMDNVVREEEDSGESVTPPHRPVTSYNEMTGNAPNRLMINSVQLTGAALGVIVHTRSKDKIPQVDGVDCQLKGKESPFELRFFDRRMSKTPIVSAKDLRLWPPELHSSRDRDKHAPKCILHPHLHLGIGSYIGHHKIHSRSKFDILEGTDGLSKSDFEFIEEYRKMMRYRYYSFTVYVYRFMDHEDF